MPFGDFAFSEQSYAAVRVTRAVIFGSAIISANLEYRIYVASKEFATSATDTLPNQPFYGTLDQPLSMKRSILGSDLIGRFTDGTGQLVLNNTDGFYDYLIQAYAIDGRDITVMVGREGDPFDQFYTIFDGTASNWMVDENAVTITLEDNGYKLLVPVQQKVYGGAGGADGTTDLTGKCIPRSFGYVSNVSPPLVVPSELVYQVNDGSCQKIVAYDRGVALLFSSDYPTYATLIGATIPTGYYSTCLHSGLFALGSSPNGLVTADVEGDNNGGFVSSSSDIVKRITSTTTGLVDPTDFYLPSFNYVALTQPAQVGYWVGPDDTSTVATTLSAIMSGIGGWCGFRRSGKLDIGIFTAPTGAPNLIFDRTDIEEIKREGLPSSVSPPPYRFRNGWGKNWTVQDDVAGVVGADRKGFLSQEYRYATSSNSTVRNDHPFAQDHEPIASYFRNVEDAQTESDRLLALYRSTKALYRFKVGVLPYSTDIGDIIQITYPRWDLKAGRLLRVVETTENAQDDSIEVVGYG